MPPRHASYEVWAPRGKIRWRTSGGSAYWNSAGVNATSPSVEYERTEDVGSYTRLVFSAARLLNNTPVFTLMRLLVSAALVALTASFASFPSPSRLGPCDLEAVATDATTRPVSIAAARALSARSS